MSWPGEGKGPVCQKKKPVCMIIDIYCIIFFLFSITYGPGGGGKVPFGAFFPL